MKLAELLAALPHKEVSGSAGIEIIGLAHDSRRVTPGDLFVAFAGDTFDGHDFIPQALAAGAVAVVGEADLRPGGVPYVRVPDARLALAQLAAAWHGYPARRLRIVGVTGTDGKTTTINLIYGLLTAAGRKAGLISTVSAIVGEGEVYETGLHTTTPDALEVQGFLARMAAAGNEYALLEATSHGLAQRRVSGCDFDVAAVTNITHEHLDYHGSYEQYRADKARLFWGLTAAHRKPGVPKVAVLNADDASFDHLRRIPADRQISYGLHGPADVTARDVAYAPDATRFVAQTPQGHFEVATRLVGRFNLYNVLAAVAVGISQGLEIEAMQAGIAGVEGVVGRMERIDEGQEFAAIVDFAHTPNALENALRTLRAVTPGRLVVVFGCAGLRDAAKRPVMGEIAGRLADVTVITAEDPRTESLEAITDQIAAGVEKAGGRAGRDYHRVPDRAEAIAFAVGLARAGDTVVVTGKGHEKSICFGTTEYPWSDREALRAALRRRSR
jgi:UDP-N-acetylmuramoyl-L-alanyl-D-glutamate--2,6-diaminopimelate ligase